MAKWTWKDGYFCRVLTGESGGEALHDCEVIETDGTRLRYTRNKGGAGEAVIVSTA